MTTKTTVIHHSADFDGIASREVAKRFLGDQAEYIGWDYPDEKIAFPAEGQVYVIDLNPDCFKEFPGIDVAQERVTWIDHHATAIEKWGTYLPGYRIDGVAACRLAYQWFSLLASTPEYREVELPGKEMFLERRVVEPKAITLLGEYDVWDHRGDGDLELQFGLRTEGDIGPMWNQLLHMDHGETYVQQLIVQGKVAMAYAQHTDASTVKHRSFIQEFAGLKFLALNTARCNSNTFATLDKPETGHDALMAFYWNGACWVFSLYHAAHNKGINLTNIARQFEYKGKRGGGHPGACGFQTDRIPFPLFAK